MGRYRIQNPTVPEAQTPNTRSKDTEKWEFANAKCCNSTFFASFAAMDSCSSLSFCFPFYSPPFSSNSGSKNKCKRAFVPVSAISYQKFVQFALDETKLHTHLFPSPLQVMGYFNRFCTWVGLLLLLHLSFSNLFCLLMLQKIGCSSLQIDVFLC